MYICLVGYCYTIFTLVSPRQFGVAGGGEDDCALAKEARNVNNSRRRSRRTDSKSVREMTMISKLAWAEDIELCTSVDFEEKKKKKL